MKKTMLPLLISLLVLGSTTGTVQGGDTSPSRPTPSVTPDNTRKNVRDRSGDTLTPFDQSESEADRTLTQRIRQAIVADESLSMTAKNIKIITVDGVVTLRGPVETEQERSRIVAKAQQIAGVNKVDSQLEIAGR